MDQRELRVLRAEADHANVLVGHAEATVEGLTRKVEKCKADLQEAREQLASAKEDLEKAEKAAVAAAEKVDGQDVRVNARAAEIKAVK